jgi:hypothetical protein
MLGIFSLTSFAWGKSPSTYFHVKAALNKITKKELINYVNEFVRNSLPSRMVGKPGHERALTYLLSTIKKVDAKETGKLTTSSFTPDVAEAQRFYQADFDQKVAGKISKTNPEYGKWLNFTRQMKKTVEDLQTFTGKNIVWEKQGLDSSKILVVTAHYDTISHDPQSYLIQSEARMPGANYNASGVAVALGLIETLARFELNYSVRVVFLDWQGIGRLGSHAYAQELKKELAQGKQIFGVINLEMLGQDTSFLDKAKKLGNMSVYLREHPTEKQWVEKLISHGSKTTDKVRFEIKTKHLKSSDHTRFQQAGLWAATFSQNWEDDFNPKFYQTPQDTPETLNHKTLYAAYHFIGGAVLGTLLDITK